MTSKILIEFSKYVPTFDISKVDVADTSPHRSYTEFLHIFDVLRLGSGELYYKHKDLDYWLVETYHIETASRSIWFGVPKFEDLEPSNMLDPAAYSSLSFVYAVEMYGYKNPITSQMLYEDIMQSKRKSML